MGEGEEWNGVEKLTPDKKSLHRRPLNIIKFFFRLCNYDVWHAKRAFTLFSVPPLPGRDSGQDLRIHFRDETVQRAPGVVAARCPEYADRKVALFSHLPLPG